MIHQRFFILVVNVFLSLAMLAGCGSSPAYLEVVVYAPLPGDDWQISTPAEQGLDDEAMLELMAVVDLMSGFNKLMVGLRVEFDEKSWHG